MSLNTMVMDKYQCCFHILHFTTQLIIFYEVISYGDNRVVDIKLFKHIAFAVQKINMIYLRYFYGKNYMFNKRNNHNLLIFRNDHYNILSNAICRFFRLLQAWWLSDQGVARSTSFDSPLSQLHSFNKHHAQVGSYELARKVSK